MALTSEVDQSDFIDVPVSFTPPSVAFGKFGTLLILTDDPAINTNERIRQYANIQEVGDDFGSTSPPFLAAELYFDQLPQPVIVFIGRWASTATAGLLQSAILTAENQLMSFWNNITNGSFHLVIDGVGHDVSGLDFSGALNLNGVAGIIQGNLRTTFANTSIICRWNSSQEVFQILSGTTGPTSTVSFGSPLGVLGGTTDISGFMGITSSRASPLVLGIAAESALDAVQALADASSAWYGLMDATNIPLSQNDHISIAAYILANSRQRMYGTSSLNSAVLDHAQTNDLASVLKSLNIRKVLTMYSSTNPYAVATMFGRGFTVDFDANDSTITLAYKQAPGLAAENLTETQFATLISKGSNCNVKVNNGAIMIWNGQMSNGYWFDEVQGVDWLQNRIQTEVFNGLYTITTKVPQTDAGSAMIATWIAQGCEAGINNGLGAPGQWNAAGFGTLKMFQRLSKGYYIYYPPVASQPENERQERISVPFQVAFKLAGAVHTSNILLNINP